MWPLGRLGMESENKQRQIQGSVHFVQDDEWWRRMRVVCFVGWRARTSNGKYRDPFFAQDDESGVVAAETRGPGSMSPALAWVG
jgi:hypothetical protein